MRSLALNPSWNRMWNPAGNMKILQYMNLTIFFFSWGPFRPSLIRLYRTSFIRILSIPRTAKAVVFSLHTRVIWVLVLFSRRNVRRNGIPAPEGVAQTARSYIPHSLPGGGPGAVLRNRNYFLRFRFRFFTSYGSGSDSGPDYWKVTVQVLVPALVPVPVLASAPYLGHKKHSFQKHLWKKSCLFTY